MGILDKLFGSRGEQPAGTEPGGAGRSALEDEQAIERYRYLLRTAPPEAVEEAHAEAFARLTPEQRAEVLRRFGESLPAGELVEARAGDPRAMAQAATRAEIRDPGYLERTLGRGGVGMGGGLGGVFGSSLLGSLAGTFLGTAIASHFLHGFGDSSSHGLAATDAVDGGRDADVSHVESGVDATDSDLDGLDTDGDFDDLDV
ncbi:MAG TPA: hypothetical protein VFE93_11810 [Myxococcaceae bacterium]|nr:hypothetical protein [Myxococcaceae bacterium]